MEIIHTNYSIRKFTRALLVREKILKKRNISIGNDTTKPTIQTVERQLEEAGFVLDKNLYLYEKLPNTEADLIAEELRKH